MRSARALTRQPRLAHERGGVWGTGRVPATLCQKKGARGGNAQGFPHGRRAKGERRSRRGRVPAARLRGRKGCVEPLALLVGEGRRRAARHVHQQQRSGGRGSRPWRVSSSRRDGGRPSSGHAMVMYAFYLVQFTSVSKPSGARRQRPAGSRKAWRYARTATAPEYSWAPIGQLTRLVGDLMDASRIGSGKVELQLQTICVSDTVERAVQTVRHMFEDRRQELAVSLPSNLSAYAPTQPGSSRSSSTFLSMPRNTLKTMATFP